MYLFDSFFNGLESVRFIKILHRYKKLYKHDDECSFMKISKSLNVKYAIFFVPAKTTGPHITNDIWYQYKEGYSNAVRKRITISHLK